ncbi:MAG: cupredoxin domain-containing protein [Acidimicrobiia bacterium]
MMRRRLRFAGLLAGVFILLSACGGGDGASPPDTASDGSTSKPTTPATGQGTPVTVKAGDLFLEPKEVTAPAGPVTFTYVNEGVQAHTLLIDGIAGFKLDVAAKGDTDTGTVDLKPGSYVLFCDIPGHREVGMESTLVVQ